MDYCMSILKVNQVQIGQSATATRYRLTAAVSGQLFKEQR